MGSANARALDVLDGEVRRAGASPVRWLAPLVGVVASLISLVGSGVPSYWSDEVATLKASRLDGAGLLELTRHKDAVHGLYYAVMQSWTAVFGDSELATRAVSAIAVGLAAAGIVLIGSLFRNLPAGMLGAVIFSVLPRTTYMGMEARSYALATAFAVWAIVLLLIAVRRETWRWWGLYALVLAVGTYLFLYSALLLIAHLAYLLALRRPPRALSGWAIAVAVMFLMTVPLIIVSQGQRAQISWLAGQPVVNAWTIVVEPWFDSSWLAAAASVALLVVGSFRLKRVLAVTGVPFVVLATGWAAAPLVALLVADAVVGPLYSARYLSFTTPGIAILLAFAALSFGRRWLAGAIVGVLVLASVPTYLAQRLPYAKNGGSDLRQVAETISEHAAPGDAFFLQNDGPVTLRPRLAVGAHPALFASLDDVAFVRSDLLEGRYPDVTMSPARIRWDLLGTDTVWVAVTIPGSSRAERIHDDLGAEGFRARASFTLNRTRVIEFQRDRYSSG